MTPDTGRAPITNHAQGRPKSGSEDALYDERYYADCCGPIPYSRAETWISFFGVIADEVIRAFKPATAFDAGCAMGLLVEALRDRGVEARGVDISSYAISKVREDMRSFCRLGSIVDPIDGKYDVVTCLEVLEHLSERDARQAAANLCAATDIILFSSTPTDVTEPTHINVHPTMYWLRMFANLGFWPDAAFDASFVAPHAMLLRKGLPPPDSILYAFSELIHQRLAMQTEGTRAGDPSAPAAAGRQLACLRLDHLQLTRKHQHLQARLEALLHSPGWRLVENYRAWLRHQKAFHPRLFRAVDGIAKLLLRKAGATQSPRGGRRYPLQSELSVAEPEYEQWIAEYEPRPEELELQRRSEAIAYRPLFSIIVPVYKVATEVLRECIESVLAQTYRHWELCIAYADSSNTANRQLLAEFGERDPRIRFRFLESNLGIAGNSNEALVLATGDFIVLLDHDDTLAPFALFEAAILLNAKPETDLLYSDQDCIATDDRTRVRPFFKPAWSPEIMYSVNYITHLAIIRKVHLECVGGFDPAMDGAQDWDVFLKVTERTQRIEHIPKVLYHWRMHSGSVAFDPSAKPYAKEAQLRALKAHMQRIGMPAEPEITREGLLHVRWQRVEKPLVSIIIPTKDKQGLLSRCISSLVGKTEYSHYEVIVIDSEHSAPAGEGWLNPASVRVCRFRGPFNYSAANNAGAALAQGELLLFLNDDVEITSPEWLGELVNWALGPGIGIVGGRLLREEGTIQHAGVIVGLDGYAGHVFAGQPRVSSGLFGSTGWYRNYLAVTGACLMLRRQVFEELKGFDESFQLCGSDVDLCLRAVQRGYRVVYNPFAELVHYEGQSRRTEFPVADYAASYRSYQPFLEAGDPYWSPNLSVWKPDISFREKGEPSSLGFVLNHLVEVNSRAKLSL